MNFDEPILYTIYEISIMRFAFAAILYHFIIRKQIDFNTQLRPIGIARWIDLTFFARPPVYRKLKFVAILCLLGYATGYLLMPVTLYLCLYSIIHGTLWNSQGKIDHFTQLLPLILLVQASQYIFQAYNNFFDPALHFDCCVENEQVTIHWIKQATIAVYLTAGIMKCLRSGSSWIRNSPWLAVELVNGKERSYYNTLVPVNRDQVYRIAEQLLHHPRLTRIVLATGLVMQLLSPLFLYNRLTNLIGGLLLLSFHQLTGRYMQVQFWQHQAVVWIYFINVPFWIIATLAI